MIHDRKEDHPAKRPAAFVPPPGTTARLHLNGRDVGGIVVEGWRDGGTVGRFAPGEAFSPFANLFGRWSLLMHEDEDRPLHAVAQSALADAERQMDALHVRVHYPDPDVWVDVRQVNIDGTMVEWVEY